MQVSELVYVNGVLLQEFVDYQVSNSQIVFNTAPEYQSEVHISTALHGGGAHVVTYRGDGWITQFPMDNSLQVAVRYDTLFANVKKYRDHPTIADLVEKLESVITLLNDETRQS
jgi:hypothetical protein